MNEKIEEIERLLLERLKGIDGFTKLQVKVEHLDFQFSAWFDNRDRPCLSSSYCFLDFAKLTEAEISNQCFYTITGCLFDYYKLFYEELEKGGK